MITVRSASRPPVRGSSSAASSATTSAISLPRSPQPDVDDDVGVAPLRDLLQQHGLAGAEAAGHGGACCPGPPGTAGRARAARCAAARRRRARSRHRARPADRPGLRQPHRSPPATGATVASAAYVPGRREPLHRAARRPGGTRTRCATGRRRRGPSRARRPATTCSPDGTAASNRHGPPRPSRPRRAGRQPRRRARQRAQQAVEDPAEQAGPEPGRQRPPSARAGRPGASPPVYS